MKIVKLHYFDTYEIFQGNRRFTKIGFEVEIDEDYEKVRDCFYTLKRQSEELFYESKAAAEKQMGTQIQEGEEKYKSSTSGIGSIVNDIYSCTELKVLESYQMLVKNKPDLQAAYDEQFKKLSQ